MAVLVKLLLSSFLTLHIGTNMTWYAVALANSNATQIGDVTAIVQQFPNLAAFKQATGTTPSQMGIPGQTDAGYPTQALAQQAANRFNALSKDQRSAGGKPLAPNLAAPALNLGNDLLGKFNLSSWFLRIGEILLGLVLIGVGIARLTGAQNAISKIVRTKLP
jgi:hypothetical protein